MRFLTLVAIAVSLFSPVALAAGAPKRPAWQPALLAPVPGTSRAYLVERLGGICSTPQHLRLVPISVDGAIGTPRMLPPYRASRCAPAGAIGSIMFATSAKGIALTNWAGNIPTLYVTSNGGATWIRRDLASVSAHIKVSAFDVTSRGVSYITSTCSNSYECRDFMLLSSSWASPNWKTMALPLAPTQFGVSQAQFGRALWIYREDGAGVTLFYSTTGRAPFTHWAAAKLSSVNACGLTATSATRLWAECPTGMLVSFFTSRDAGRTWRTISRYAFSGTGGGAFDPVSPTLAYLDYGADSTVHHENLVRIDNAGRSTPVGRLACMSVDSLDFTNASDGMALCWKSPSGPPGIERTTDGGRTWLTVSLGTI